MPLVFETRQPADLKAFPLAGIEMEQRQLAATVENLDRRLERVEQILPTLATKEDLRLRATKEDVSRESERSRRYMKVLVEDLKDTINLYAERLTAADERDARQHTESMEAAKTLDGRVTALGAASRRLR